MTTSTILRRAATRTMAITSPLALTLAIATTSAQAQSYPTSAPAPAPVKPAALPPFQEAVLTNGVRVVLVENHRNPVVAFRLAVPAGDMFDPKDKSGTASMVSTLLTKGAGARTAEQIAAAIESAGGSLNAFTGDDYLSVSGSVLSNAAPLAFELLGDAVTRPTFSEKEFELARTQTLSALQLAASNPSSLAARFFNAGLYGNHPYGRTATATSVRAITRADLLAFQTARLKPAGAVLVVAGDITLGSLKALAEKGFKGWTGTPAASPVLAAPPTRAATEIVLVHRAGSVQSNLLVGNLTTGPADPTRYAASIANRVLGGNSDSRLFMVLREKKGWTYGAYSSLSYPRGVGKFEANAEVRTEVTDSSLVELLAQLRTVTSEPISAKEIEQAKNAIVGGFPLTIETPQQLAERVANVKLYGLGSDYLQNFRTRVSAVTAAQIQQAARASFKPANALVVVVGDGTKIYDKLKAIAPVRVISVDGDPMTPADFTPKAMGLPADFTRLAAARDSFVVMVQGNALGYSVYSVESRTGGWTLRESTNVMNGMIVQKTALETDGSLAPTSLIQSGSMQGQALTTNIAFAGGKATGRAMSAAQTGPKTIDVNATLPSGTIEADAVQSLVRLLRWSADAKFTLNVFNAGKGIVETLTMAVVGSESVTVPAGTFDTWKVEQKQGETSAMMYVTKDASRRVVKIAPVGQPIELVLAK